MAVISEEPILSRLDRLDHILRQLEGSGASTPTSGTRTSEGQDASSTDISPRSLEKHCRPIDRVITETEVKGTLVERLELVEERMLKLCSRFEGGGSMEPERKGEQQPEHPKKKKKGLKGLMNKVVRGNRNHKTME